MDRKDIKTRFIFVRHSQSEANVEAYFAGRTTDSPLTELGHDQAGIMAKYVLDKYKINAV